MKRLLCLVLVVALLGGVMGAYAENHNISATLRNFAFFESNGVFERWGEWNSTTNSWSLEMDEGDYAEIQPVHRLLTNYLSYSLEGVQSSDPSVVEAAFASPSGGNLGIKLHAIGEGDATVTASFSTYLSKAGLKYNDKRGDSSFTKTVNVHVNGTGEVTMTLNVGSEGSSVKGFTIGMEKMIDTLPAAEQAQIKHRVEKKVDSYSESGVDDVSLLNNEGFLIPDLVVSAGAEHLLKNVVYKAMNFTYDIFSRVVGIFDLARTAAEMANDVRWVYETTKKMTMPVPVVNPKSVKAEVTIENGTNHQVSITPVLISADNHLSFSSIYGPWGTTEAVGQGFTLAPHTTWTYETYVYPRFVYNTMSADGSAAFAYDATITASTNYIDLTTGLSGALKETKSLPTYTSITSEKLKDFKAALWREYRATNVDTTTSKMLGGAFNGYERWYGFYRFDQLFTFACPVEIAILDASGEELAVIGADGEAFAADGICAFCVGETKYVSLSPSAIGDYRIEPRATGDGEMDVMFYQFDSDSGLCLKTFAAVPVATDDQFSLTLYADTAADLSRVDESGGNTVLDPDEVIEQQDIVEAFKAANLPEDEAEDYAALLTWGVLSEEMANEPGADMSVERFAGLLGNAAERIFGFVNENIDEDADGIALAEGLGILTTEEAERLGRDGMKVSDALTMTDRILEGLGFVNSETQWGWAMDSDVDLAELPDYTGTDCGVSYTFGLSDGMELEDTLTAGSAALIVRRLLETVNAARERDDYVNRIVDAYRNSLRWENLSDVAVTLGTEDGNEAKTLYGNFGFWFTNTPGYDHLYERNGISVSRLRYNYEEVAGKEGIWDSITSEGFAMTASSTLDGFSCDTNGVVARWTPFAFIDDEGNFYEDSVYLAISLIEEGVAEDYLEKGGFKPIKWKNATVERYLIEDQDVVAAYLNRVTAMNQKPAMYEEGYEEFSKGSKGDGVKAVQESLIRLGYLDGKADGSYGKMTATAVSAFQQAMGLEETGVADAHTQFMLFTSDNDDEKFIDWMNRYYSPETEEAAEAELSRREADNQYEVYLELVK